MPSTRLETITPAKALKLLENSAANRGISSPHVKRLASAMLNREWEVNGETFKINKKNKMIDGQHRCHAVIQSGVTIESFVCRGLGDNTFDTIDGGKPRNLAAIMSKHGEVSVNQLAAAVGWLWRYKKGLMKHGLSNAPRIPEGLEILKNNPEIRDSMWVYSLVGQRKNGIPALFPGSLAVTMHYIFSRKSKEEADSFFRLLESGEGLSKNDPATSGIYLLRNRLEQNRFAQAKKPLEVIAACTIKAWNSVREEKPIKILRMNTTIIKEKFPTVK